MNFPEPGVDMVPGWPGWRSKLEVGAGRRYYWEINPDGGTPFPATWLSPWELEQRRRFARGQQTAAARRAEEIAAAAAAAADAHSKAVQDAQQQQAYLRKLASEKEQE